MAKLANMCLRGDHKLCKGKTMMGDPCGCECHNDGADPYDAWKKRVNDHVLTAVGMECDDLPDYDYRRAFDAGESPKTTAKRAIRAAKEF